MTATLRLIAGLLLAAVVVVAGFTVLWKTSLGFRQLVRALLEMIGLIISLGVLAVAAYIYHSIT